MSLVSCSLQKKHVVNVVYWDSVSGMRTHGSEFICSVPELLFVREGFIKKKKKIREFSLSPEGPPPPSIIREKIFFCFFIYGV